MKEDKEDVKKRMKATLEETIEYYDHPDKAGWSKYHNSCVYKEFEGDNKCAVGRCLKDNIKGHIFEHEGSVSSLNSCFGLEENLKKKYKGFPLEFWERLQNLHDDWASECLINRHKKNEPLADFPPSQRKALSIYKFIEEY